MRPGFGSGAASGNRVLEGALREGHEPASVRVRDVVGVWSESFRRNMSIALISASEHALGKSGELLMHS